MARFAVVIALVCFVPSTRAQGVESELYARIESLASDVVSAHLSDGLACTWPNPAVAEKQVPLAIALAEAAPLTGPLVLLYAVTANDLEQARRLVEAGASREDPWGTLLHTAAVFGDAAMLEYLTSIGLDVDELGNATAPAVLVAAAANRRANVTWLIEHGADINATDTSGVKLLQHALVCQDQSLVDFLLQAGALPDETTRAVAARLGLTVDRGSR